MLKKKKQFAPFKSELHTITPMPLETVEARLQELEITSDALRVYTQYMDQDHRAVKIIYQNDKGSKVAEIIGSFSRWEGTYTRVDADSRTFTYLEWVDQLLSAIRMIGLIALLYPACGILGYLITAASMTNLLGLVFSVMTALTLTRYLPPVDLSKNQRYKAYKVVDTMMQGIADKLTEDKPDAEPMLEFDGTEDSLAHLLRQEKFKHFAVGDDGELIR